MVAAQAACDSAAGEKHDPPDKDGVVVGDTDCVGPT